MEIELLLTSGVLGFDPKTAKACHEEISKEIVHLYGEDAEEAQNLYDKLLIHYAEAMLTKSEKMKGRNDALYNLQRIMGHYANQV